MSREIKFRAWDIESPGMMSWEELQDEWESEGYYDSVFRGDHWIPMQYTGLKDDKGEEVYEGDILHLLDDELEDGREAYCEVVWRNDGWKRRWATDIIADRFYPLDDLGNKELHFVKIGNVYENPELLEKASEDQDPST